MPYDFGCHSDCRPGACVCAVLSAEGKKLARINCISTLETPEEYVQAQLLFDLWYLKGSDTWYDGTAYEAAPLHNEIAYCTRAFRRNLIGAPRGFAKSTQLRKQLLLNLCTGALGNKNALVKFIDTQVERDVQKLMDELLQNEALIGDFGMLRAGRGLGMWNHHTLKLANNCWLIAGSVTGGIRGERIMGLGILDDPEDDREHGERLSKSHLDRDGSRRAVVKQKFARFLFRKFMRMMGPQAYLTWVGTLLDRSAFIFEASSGQDPRFDPQSWNIRVFGCYDENGQSRWPSAWPVKLLEEERRSIGEEAFQAEMMNNPGSEQALCFSMEKDKIGYRLNGPLDLKAPLLDSATTISFKRYVRQPDGSDKEEAICTPYAAWARTLHRVITVDLGGTGQYNDPSCIAVSGLDKNRDLYVLDLWLGKCRSEQLIRMVWDYAVRWRVRVVGIEAVALQQEFWARAADLGETIAQQTGYAPQCVPITYPYGYSKADRIGALEWRFGRGKLKVPLDRCARGGDPFATLWEQFMQFTPDLRLLKNDDAADTIAMVPFLVKGAGARRFDEVPLDVGPLAQLMRGELVDKRTGLPNILAIPFNQLPYDIVAKRIGLVQDAPDEPHAFRSGLQGGSL